jgi:hypothetical protein
MPPELLRLLPRRYSVREFFTGRLVDAIARIDPGAVQGEEAPKI